jgi:membrane protein DedA with SNARE-associated domain
LKTFFLILFSTLISEDLTCISSGILIQEGSVDPVTGTLACTLGIFLGDYLLYLTGKELHGFLRKRDTFQFLFESESFATLSEKLNNSYAKTIFLSRFMPGTRLPIYTFAGMVSKTSLPFLGYSFLASILWTPVMVYLAFSYGETFKRFYQTNQFYLFLFICIGSFFLVYQLILISLISEKRRDMVIFFSKLFKLEFWPVWIFYLPLIPYVGYLILRYGTIRNISISNPSIPFSGIAFESKSDILKNLPKEFVARFYLLSYSSNRSIDKQILDAITECGGSFPMILKPDIGERGAGIKIVSDSESILKILEETKVDYILQEYHPGPFEAGIFYYRFPSETKGKIFSITDKVFPKLEGDGKTNLQDLIHKHPRFRFQSATFLKRLQTNRSYIPKEGETISLGFAGNHIQGCMFCDGKHLITDVLEEKIDFISKQFPGFYFGRYDIRYASQRDLKAGENFKIIELNGAMSESTNLYDPNFSILKSYSILFSQWKILFQIGRENRKLGIKFPTWKSFFLMLKSYNEYKKKIDPIAK